MTRDVTLLGPQRRPSVEHVVGDLDQERPVATVTAGWQEREGEDAELSDAARRAHASTSRCTPAG